MGKEPAYYKEIIHNSKRRAPWHDYHSRCIYMVTVTKMPGVPIFGTVMNVNNPKKAFIKLTEIGKIICEEITATPSRNTAIRILEHIVMPDHFHILLYISQPIEKALGDIVQSIKASVTRRVRALLSLSSLTVFEKGFNDRIITQRGQLDILHRYIRENPRRLAARKAHPEYFTRVNTLRIGEGTYSAYGNFQLLDFPSKEQIVIHRADTSETLRHNRDLWLYTAANRGVLVSPFISQAEKDIRAEAEKVGGRFILITCEPMGERYKPSGSDFALCTEGRLLIISIPSISKILTRETCQRMNALASRVSKAINFDSTKSHE